MARAKNNTNRKEVYHLLDKNENVSSILYSEILDVLDKKQRKHPDSEVWVIESDDNLGLIIDVVQNGEVLEEESETYWFEHFV